MRGCTEFDLLGLLALLCLIGLLLFSSYDFSGSRTCMLHLVQHSVSKFHPADELSSNWDKTFYLLRHSGTKRNGPVTIAERKLSINQLYYRAVTKNASPEFVNDSRKWKFHFENWYVWDIVSKWMRAQKYPRKPNISRATRYNYNSIKHIIWGLLMTMWWKCNQL